MSTLLVVCTANVCRSPLGERLLQLHLAPALGIDVSSAGVRGLVGAEMCPVSALELPSGDPFPARHVARSLERDLVMTADLVVTMEREHRSAAVRLAPGAQSKVFTLSEALMLARGLDERGGPPAADLATLAKQLHGMRGIVVPQAPEEAKRRLFRRRPHPADPLTIVDGHGLDPDSHSAATRQVHEITDRFAELLGRRLVS